jgi:PAS domain S-box-containing protein
LNVIEPSDVGIGKLFDRVPDAVIVIDCATGRVLLWNPAATTLFGYTADQARQESIEMIIPPEFRERHRAGLARYFATGHGRLIDGQVPLILPALRKSGERIAIELTLSPLDAAEGNNAGARLALAIIRDLSERTRAEEARAAEQSARELSRRMDTLVGIVGHELMSPITAIRGNIELAARRVTILTKPPKLNVPWPEADVDALEAALQRALTASDRLELLVRDLLDVTRIQANKMEMHTAPVDLLALTRQVVEAQQSAAETTRFDLDLPAREPVFVDVDAYRIEQVITNYLSNALKYAATKPVSVDLRVEQAAVRVSVSDQGPGVPPEALAHVWDRFFQVDKKEGRQAGRPGLGLGLFICRTIVEQHGGTVGVESAPGQGATFWFTLPLPPNDTPA